jgi:hypothetical protein
VHTPSRATRELSREQRLVHTPLFGLRAKFFAQDVQNFGVPAHVLQEGSHRLHVFD